VRERCGRGTSLRGAFDLPFPKIEIAIAIEIVS